jgi:O-acetyl-ADP-ribose deacetylase (regulator of RNase III)
VRVGRTVTYGDRLAVSVVRLREGRAGEYTYGASNGQEVVIAEVRVTNGTRADVDLTLCDVRARLGPDQVQAYELHDREVVTPARLEGSLAAGRMATGAYGFPVERATRIAVGEVARALGADRDLERVVFCCFSDGDLEVYDRVATELLGAPRG